MRGGMLRLRLLILLGVLGVVYVGTLVRRDHRAHPARLVAMFPVAHADGQLRVAGNVFRDGAGLAHARVQLVGLGIKSSRIERSTISDARGAFDLGDVPIGSYQVTATAAGATVATDFIGSSELGELPLRYDRLALHMDRCAVPAVGTVVDRAGAPIAGVEIGPDLIPVTTSAADGSFQICAADGSLLTFRDSGRGAVARKIWTSRRLEVELAPQASIEGQVVHAGKPVANARVWVMAVHGGEHDGFGANAFAMADADGRFRIDGLATGQAVLLADVPGLERDGEPHDRLVPVVAGEIRRDVVVTMRER